MGDPIRIDTHKLIYHPERVAEWRRTGDCYPIKVEVGTTSRCNQDCVFCALEWVRGREDINRDIMLNALEDMAQHGVKGIYWGGEGEPTIHPSFIDFIQIADEVGLESSLSTNGQLFGREKVDDTLHGFTWLRYSIDAATNETYQKIHRPYSGSIRDVFDNIKYAVRVREEQGRVGIFKGNPIPLPTIGTQILILPSNIGEVEELARIVRDLGADNLQVKPFSHHPKSEHDFSVDSRELEGLREELEKINTNVFRVIYREQTKERVEREKQYDNCRAHSFDCLIDSRGNVLPCNMFYDDEDFIFGNLYETEGSFSEVWEGEKRKEVKKRLEEMDLSECRRGCVLDAQNEYLDRLLNPHPHENFP